ncbi:hypothetical protein WG899_19500 [Paucibacter sp. AS339]|uniref:hypothetical protein n=1 Tax=Paucibacter hankyongi TaxID=3133434 RepID=UPI003095B563
MNDHKNAPSGTSTDLPPPLPPQRPGTSASAPSHNERPPAPFKSVSTRPNEPLPIVIKGWCWGGFLLNWVWAIRFRVWWGLLVLVPFVGLAVPIWLGIKGRELAWRRGEWTSVQAFNDEQRKWSIGGAVVTALACLVYGGSFAYERRQAHQAEAAASGPGMTPEQMAKIISAPVDLKKLGVATSVDLSVFEGAQAGTLLKDAYWGPKIAAITPGAGRQCVDQTLPELPPMRLTSERLVVSAAHGSHAENWVAGLLQLGADGQVELALVCDMASDHILLMTSRDVSAAVSPGVKSWLGEQGSADTKVTVFDGKKALETTVGALLGTSN